MVYMRNLLIRWKISEQRTSTAVVEVGLIRRLRTITASATLCDVEDARPVAIVDIDGVVADVRHRLGHIKGPRKDWDTFFSAAIDDPVHPEGVAAVTTLAAEHEVVFVTGRPERLRSDTETWLVANGIDGHRLVMRANADRRPSALIKVEEITALATTRAVAIVVDDDPRVITAVRAAGYPTFTAKWERRSSAEDDALTAAQQCDGQT
jgi:hypothetical protein